MPNQLGMLVHNVSKVPVTVLNNGSSLTQKANLLGLIAEVDVSKMSELEKNDIKDKCAELEGIFVKMILDLMRKSTQSSDSSMQGLGKQENDMYHDLLNGEYAKIISNSNGGLGIGDMIYKQLTTPVISAQEVAKRYTNS